MAIKACIKFVLFCFNVVFWLAGLGAIGIGIWMIFDPGRFNEFLGKYTFTIPASILIATGLFVCMVGYCGCAGAIRESKCLLGTYFTMLLLIFCAEVAAGVLGFLYREKIKEEVTAQSKNVIQSKYGDGNVDIDHAVDTLQQKLKCCGASDRSDYITSKWYENKGSTGRQYPPSCCGDTQKCSKESLVVEISTVYKIGCIDQLITYTKDNLFILGVIGVSFSAIQLIGMCFACCLFFAIEEVEY